MTVTEKSFASHHRPTIAEWTSAHPGWTVVIRWSVLLALTGIAFWNTIVAIVEEMYAQTLIGYVPILLLLCAIAAIGVSWRRHLEPPIYDRQTDVIVGLIVLSQAIVIKYLVTPRYSQTYLTAHMDLLALWVFVLGAAIMMFGLRPVARYRWVWLIFLAIWPIPTRVIVLTLGGSSFAEGAVTVLYAAGATAIAVGRTWRRAAAGAAMTMAVGLVTLVGAVAVGGSRISMVTIPALAAALATSTVMYIDYRHRGGHPWSPLGREVLPPTLKQVGRPGVVVVLAAACLAFIPVPPVGTWPSAYIAGMPIGQPQVMPPGWRQESITRYDWVTRLYGPESVLIRQAVVQSRGDVAYDKQGRPRRVMVDSVDTERPLALEVYPYIFRYDLVGDRFSPAVEVKLPEGVRSWIWTVVDDVRYLTYTVLSWWWNNGDRTQQMMLWSVDNHEPDARFPAPEMTVTANLNTMFTVMFRGNAVIQAVDQPTKDRDLLVSLGTALVTAQADAAARSAT
ncbi:hypothetical protein [Gordonia sp. ABSL49_1]|uniref:hypothetical protein n=1 Tax=Gordonia sp. ABSL49_1 TaxID=2920941 RepID=UPI001F0E7C63|nr:hypothetical protein [Gordonia sp. ABSL49_1]MCH5645645.1 hypothetical protein [Gordonia sp. ABSL49_1]